MVEIFIKRNWYVFLFLVGYFWMKTLSIIVYVFFVSSLCRYIALNIFRLRILAYIETGFINFVAAVFTKNLNR